MLVLIQYDSQQCEIQIAMKNQKQIIPMDNAIKEFGLHLKSHPRTILSAKFGDGKSTFLNAAEKKLKNRLLFLKIFPVNYQVADNLDVFDLIKRDLLYQLYEKGVVSDTYEIPDDIASFFYLQNNWDTFAKEILKGLSYFDSSNTIQAALGAAKFLMSVKKKYESFKDNGGEIGERLDGFISSFETRLGIYEADPITSIICDIIKDWKSRNRRKKICLVFEDLDRIDPAHIFRILNVISAHMDYGYKYGTSPMSYSLAGNKFGVDNIVVCLDYNNLSNIFTHFYGSETGFNGYINKFCDKGVFYYSLKEQVQKYYSQQLAIVTSMSENAISAVTEKYDFSKHTLREFCHALDDVESQIILPKARGHFLPHKGLYIIAAILRRLNCEDSVTVELLSQAFRNHPEEVGCYIATSMFLRESDNIDGNEFSFGNKQDFYLVRYELTNIKNDGTASVKKRLFSEWNPMEQYCQPEDDVKYILNHVSK